MFSVFNQQDPEQPTSIVNKAAPLSAQSPTSPLTSPRFKLDISSAEQSSTGGAYQRLKDKGRAMNILKRVSGDGESLFPEHGCHSGDDEMNRIMELLASDEHNENLVGMYRLVALANSDLVNTRFDGSAAETLLFEDGTRNSSKLQSLYLYYFCGTGCPENVEASLQIPDIRLRTRTKALDISVDDEATMSTTTDPCNESSESSEDYVDPHMRHRFRLPALRALLSALELMIRREEDFGAEFDFDNLSPFWNGMISAMVDLITSPASRGSLQAAFCVKAFRLLTKMHSERIGPVVRASVLPHLNLDDGDEMIDNLRFRVFQLEATRLLEQYVEQS